MDATRVRDPVHNFITLEEEEVKLLRTRALQRLRGIKQLALASLVYPGAVHTRFDHTLGDGQPALRSIVSGPLDADKQDYLLRDSLFCGVQYGVFDIYQLHRSLTVYGPKDEKELMIEPDGLHAVEQFVLAKYYLTTNVY